MNTINDPSWMNFLDSVIASAKKLSYFLPAFEVSGLHRQAGDSYRDGDAMVDTMNLHCVAGRDQAIALLQSRREARGVFKTLLETAMNDLTALSSGLSTYDRYGAEAVVATLRERARQALKNKA